MIKHVQKDKGINRQEVKVMPPFSPGSSVLTHGLWPVLPHIALVRHLNGLHLRNPCKYTDYYSFTDSREMEGWVGLVDRPTAGVYPQSGHLSTIDQAHGRESPQVKAYVLCQQQWHVHCNVHWQQSRHLQITRAKLHTTDKYCNRTANNWNNSNSNIIKTEKKTEFSTNTLIPVTNPSTGFNCSNCALCLARSSADIIHIVSSPAKMQQRTINCTGLKSVSLHCSDAICWEANSLEMHVTAP